MSLNKRPKVPLTVIGGFLGAGKTTYLDALIRRGIPDNSLIVINDFGDINIDAELIDYCDERMVMLNNGCICCTLGGTLAEQLAKAMRLHDCPEAVFIETSGVADPARIADIARISNRLELAEVICLVDGNQAQRHRVDPFTAEIWHAQICAADRILLNRLPPKDNPEAAQLMALFRQLNPTVRIEITDQTETALATEPLWPRAINDRQLIYHIPVSQGNWQSISLSMKAPVDPQRLQSLLLEYRDVLLRAKGFLYRQDRPHCQLLQFSGGQVNWLSAGARAGRSQLVCIGRKGSRFDALVDSLLDLGKANGHQYRYSNSMA